jgi:hypothetical protein
LEDRQSGTGTASSTSRPTRFIHRVPFEQGQQRSAGQRTDAHRGKRFLVDRLDHCIRECCYEQQRPERSAKLASARMSLPQFDVQGSLFETLGAIRSGFICRQFAQTHTHHLQSRSLIHARDRLGAARIVATVDRTKLRTTDSTVALLDLGSPAAFRAKDDNGCPSEQSRESAVRIGLVDIQAD